MGLSNKGNPAFNENQAQQGVRGFLSVCDRPVVRKSIGVRLYEDQLDPFEQACKDAGLTRVEMVRQLVDDFLQKSDRPNETNNAA
jgi:hypothetical protein